MASSHTLGQDDDSSDGRAVAIQTAELLRRLLDMVEAGELEADGWQGEAIRQRLEGATIVLEAVIHRPAR